jgi:hypothetical protein
MPLPCPDRVWPRTIDRLDDATGENLIEQITRVATGKPAFSLHRMPRRDSAEVPRCRVTNPLKEALTALADVLAKRRKSYSTGFALDGWSANSLS